MPKSHAVVWLDHVEACIFHFNRDSADKTALHRHPHSPRHKHGALRSGRDPDDIAFFLSIAQALEDTREVLLVGPGAAKLEFLRYVTRSQAWLERIIVGCETVDHPTDRQLLAYARKYFHAKDRMLPLLAS